MLTLAKKILPVAAKLRAASDTCEQLVADHLWELPKYREMLFANTIS